MTLQRLLSYVRKAVSDYRLIEEGDNIAVGVSGGRTAFRCLPPLRHTAGFLPGNNNLCRHYRGIWVLKTAKRGLVK